MMLNPQLVEPVGMQAEGESDVLRDTLVAQISHQITKDSISIRSVSHGVRPEQPGRERVQCKEELATSLLHTPFPGTAVALIWFASAILTVSAAIGLFRGFLQVSLSALAIWWIFRWARNRMSRGRAAGLV